MAPPIVANRNGFLPTGGTSVDVNVNVGNRGYMPPPYRGSYGGTHHHHHTVLVPTENLLYYNPRTVCHLPPPRPVPVATGTSISVGAWSGHGNGGFVSISTGPQIMTTLPYRPAYIPRGGYYPPYHRPHYAVPVVPVVPVAPAGTSLFFSYTKVESDRHDHRRHDGPRREPERPAPHRDATPERRGNDMRGR